MTDEKIARIKKAIVGETVETSITPYMQMYNFACLFESGESAVAEKKIRA